MSDKTTIRFNGVDLTAGFVVSDLVRPFLMRTINTTQVDGRDGAIYRSSSYDAIDVKMRLSFESTDRNERVVAMANLVKALDVDEPARLEISDDDGWYYLAVPKGGDITRWIGAESFPLTFVCPDPRRIGNEFSYQLPSVASSSTPVVGGNVSTSPVVTFTAVPKRTTPTSSRYASSITIQGIFSGGSRPPRSDIYLDFPDSTQRSISIDFEHRLVTAAIGSGTPSVVVPSAASVFADFVPGARYSAIMTGSSGSATATYRERWL